MAAPFFGFMLAVGPPVIVNAASSDLPRFTIVTINPANRLTISTPSTYTMPLDVGIMRVLLLELCRTRGAMERDHIPDVLHACQIHEHTLEPQPESGMRC